jgi:hypothetical protein
MLVWAQKPLEAEGLWIRFSPEKVHYITWERLRLYVEIGPPLEDAIVDMYLGVQPGLRAVLSCS